MISTALDSFSMEGGVVKILVLLLSKILNLALYLQFIKDAKIL